MLCSPARISVDADESMSVSSLSEGDPTCWKADFAEIELVCAHLNEDEARPSEVIVVVRGLLLGVGEAESDMRVSSNSEIVSSISESTMPNCLCTISFFVDSSKAAFPLVSGELLVSASPDASFLLSQVIAGSTLDMLGVLGIGLFLTT